MLAQVEPDDPSVVDCPFPVAPCHCEERGDGFAATRNLSSGDLVLRVAPLAAVPKDAFISSVCACCFRRGGLADDTSLPSDVIQDGTGRPSGRPDAAGQLSTGGKNGRGGVSAATAATAKALDAAAEAPSEPVGQRSGRGNMVAVAADAAAAVAPLLKRDCAGMPSEPAGQRSSRGKTCRGGAAATAAAAAAAAAAESKEATPVPRPRHDLGGEASVEAAPISWDDRGVELRLCRSCGAAAFCSRCLRSAWVTDKHREECHALGALMAMQRCQLGFEQAGTSQPSAPGHKRAAAAEGGEAERDGDTTTLRLVLSIACFAARVRRERRPSCRRAGARDGPDVTACAPGDLLGEDDVMQDSLEDLEQLFGEPETDVPAPMYTRLHEACRLLKSVQPAWARTSLEQYTRLAAKALLNQHDICLPVLPPADVSGSRSGIHGSSSTASEGAGAARVPPGRGSCAAAPPTGPATAVAVAVSCKRTRSMEATAAAAATLCPRDLLCPLGTEAVGEGLYPSVARLNHSCAPNCQLSYDAYGCLVVRVRRGMSVSKGEELFAAYVDPQAPREARRRHLHERYGFWCACSSCSSGK